MTLHAHYRLNRHRKIERNGQKYVADLETNDIVEVNDVEWEILECYNTHTQYQIVEGLKEKYKVTTIFDGIERLERFGKQGVLFHLLEETNSQHVADWKRENRKPKVLVPFHFTKEKLSLDYQTSLNRYQLLIHLTKFAELETLIFSEAGKADPEQQNIWDFGENIRTRHIEAEKGNPFASSWYAMNGYDGILLLSQYLTDDLLYYRVPDVPIVHCIEGVVKFKDATLEMLLNLHALQGTKTNLVVNNSWLKAWLEASDLPEKKVSVIPDGINIGEPIDKALAKQHTAALFDKPILAQQPVVGIISGFELRSGVQFISDFARANPQLAVFVYDSILAEHYLNLPKNVVIFRAEDEDTRSILPIFFQALDLVCFPAIIGTPLSLVLEAMAYGTPCIAMSKYGLPSEVDGAGVAVEAETDGLGYFQVSLSQLSKTAGRLLKPSDERTRYESIASHLIQRYTWEETAQKIIHLFTEKSLTHVDSSGTLKNMFPPIFCQRYDPSTSTTTSHAYQPRTHSYESVEIALAAVLSEHYTPAEVEVISKHFQGMARLPQQNNCFGDGVPNNIGNPSPPDPSPGRKENT